MSKNESSENGAPFDEEGTMMPVPAEERIARPDVAKAFSEDVLAVVRRDHAVRQYQSPGSGLNNYTYDS